MPDRNRGNKISSRTNITKMHQLPARTLLRGNTYQIEKFINAGGFGNTYVGFHFFLKKRVAIKEFFVKDICQRKPGSNMMLVKSPANESMVNELRVSFFEEAMAIAALQHPGIVRVTDAFQENNTAYYVMELIPGKSLNEILTQNGPLDEKRAVGYIRRVAYALKYLHDKNRLHFDIKPGNILLDANGSPVLIDFGCSKLYVDGRCSLSSSFTKTPGYASPEQMDDQIERFNPAMDVYSLGATLYKLLTGITPLSTKHRLAGEKLAPLPRSISRNVVNAIIGSLEIDPKKRIPSMDIFLKVLDSNPEAYQKQMKSKEAPKNAVDDDEIEIVEVVVKGGRKIVEKEHTKEGRNIDSHSADSEKALREDLKKRCARTREALAKMKISQASREKLLLELNKVAKIVENANETTGAIEIESLSATVAHVEREAKKIEARDTALRYKSEIQRRSVVINDINKAIDEMENVNLPAVQKDNLVNMFYALLMEVNDCQAGAFDEVKQKSVSDALKKIAADTRRLEAEHLEKLRKQREAEERQRLEADRKMRHEITDGFSKLDKTMKQSKLPAAVVEPLQSRLGKVMTDLDSIAVKELSEAKARQFKDSIEEVEKEFLQAEEDRRAAIEEIRSEIKKTVEAISREVAGMKITEDGLNPFTRRLLNLKMKIDKANREEINDIFKTSILSEGRKIKEEAGEVAEAQRRAEAARKAEEERLRKLRVDERLRQNLIAKIDDLYKAMRLVGSSLGTTREALDEIGEELKAVNKGALDEPTAKKLAERIDAVKDDFNKREKKRKIEIEERLKEVKDALEDIEKKLQKLNLTQTSRSKLNLGIEHAKADFYAESDAEFSRVFVDLLLRDLDSVYAMALKLEEEERRADEARKIETERQRRLKVDEALRKRIAGEIASLERAISSSELTTLEFKEGLKTIAASLASIEAGQLDDAMADSLSTKIKDVETAYKEAYKMWRIETDDRRNRLSEALNDLKNELGKVELPKKDRAEVNKRYVQIKDLLKAAKRSSVNKDFESGLTERMGRLLADAKSMETAERLAQEKRKAEEERSRLVKRLRNDLSGVTGDAVKGIAALQIAYASRKEFDAKLTAVKNRASQLPDSQLTEQFVDAIKKEIAELLDNARATEVAERKAEEERQKRLEIDNELRAKLAKTFADAASNIESAEMSPESRKSLLGRLAETEKRLDSLKRGELDDRQASELRTSVEAIIADFKIALDAYRLEIDRLRDEIGAHIKQGEKRIAALDVAESDRRALSLAIAEVRERLNAADNASLASLKAGVEGDIGKIENRANRMADTLKKAREERKLALRREKELRQEMYVRFDSVKAMVMEAEIPTASADRLTATLTKALDFMESVNLGELTPEREKQVKHQVDSVEHLLKQEVHRLREAREERRKSVNKAIRSLEKQLGDLKISQSEMLRLNIELANLKERFYSNSGDIDSAFHDEVQKQISQLLDQGRLIEKREKETREREARERALNIDKELRGKIIKRIDKLSNELSASEIDSAKLNDLKRRLEKEHRAIMSVKQGDFDEAKATAFNARVEELENLFAGMVDVHRNQLKRRRAEIEEAFKIAEKNLGTLKLEKNDRLQLNLALANLKDQYFSVNDRNLTDEFKAKMLSKIESLEAEAGKFAAQSASSKDDEATITGDVGFLEDEANDESTTPAADESTKLLTSQSDILVSIAENEDITNPESTANRNKKIVTILCAVIAAAVIAIVVMLVMRRSGADAPVDPIAAETEMVDSNSAH